jgi:hypothetical protein
MTPSPKTNFDQQVIGTLKPKLKKGFIQTNRIEPKNLFQGSK